MKLVLTTALFAATLASAVACATEGVWAANSGSIHNDEAALSSSKPAFSGYPQLMPHQG